MLIPQDIIDKAQADPLDASLLACRYAKDMISMNGNNTQWTDDEHTILLEAYALLSTLVDSKLINIQLISFSTSGEIHSECTLLLQIIEKAEIDLAAQAAHNKLLALKQNFAIAVGTEFAYEFSNGDLSRVQTLLNELRELVANASDIDGAHKQRLLKRLEQLQSELHKKTSDLSRFYGLLGEAGVVLGKFGEDAKPIVDRVKEIIQITWNTQARAEELPSGTTPPLLEKDWD